MIPSEVFFTETDATIKPVDQAMTALQLKVIAEGVETEEEVNLLRRLKCNEIHGFLFSPAVPAENIETYLREKIALGYQKT